jgi:hypothetical protein
VEIRKDDFIMLSIEMPIDDILPFHEVRHARKMRTLAERMSASGWQGRPLLAVETVQGIQALTGSHRLAAARKAGLSTVPVYVITVSERDAKFLLRGDDHKRLYLLELLGLKDAAQLMIEEISGEAI